MGKELDDIARYLREICESNKMHIIQGEVTAVADNATITIKVDDEVELPDVRLRVVTGKDMGIIVTPSVGAQVVVGVIEGGQDHQLLHASEIDRYYVRAGNTLFDITQNGVVINEGNLGGMAKIAELTQKLNQLETQVNTLLSILSAINVPLASTGNVPFAPFFASVSPLTPTTQTELENLKVKQ